MARRFFKSVVRFQDAEGMWHQEMTMPQSFVEVSGSAVLLYGLGAGDNTRAALLTRGQAEMCRLGMALGANPHTFAGLAGMGDLIVTCLSEHSRNRYVGEHIGKGESLDQILKDMKMIAEGVPTCRSAKALAEKSGVEMPLVNAIYESLFNGKSALESIRELMGRELKSEIW